MRPRKVHWRQIFDTGPSSPETLCGRTLTHNGRYLVDFVERNNEYVTCCACLYHLGLYMPLVKLVEHQQAQRMLGEAWRARVSSWIQGPTP
jgi:hypothetical protein